MKERGIFKATSVSPDLRWRLASGGRRKIAGKRNFRDGYNFLVEELVL
jgi:hypothetical protein